MTIGSHSGDIFGKIDMNCPRFLTLGGFKGSPYHFRGDTRPDDLFIPFRHRGEHGHKIQVLMGFNVHPVGSHLAGDGHQGRPIEVSIGYPCH